MADILPLRPSDPAPVAVSESATAPTPLLVDAKRLAELLGVGLRTIRSWDSSGRLPAPLRIGGRVAWQLDIVRRWLDAGAPSREVWAARTAARK